MIRLRPRITRSSVNPHPLVKLGPGGDFQDERLWADETPRSKVDFQRWGFQARARQRSSALALDVAYVVALAALVVFASHSAGKRGLVCLALGLLLAGLRVSLHPGYPPRA